MRCPRAKEMLALYVGGDLPESMASRLEAHLKSCRDCAAELDSLRRSLVAIEDIRRVDIPDDLPDSFADQVMKKAASGDSPPADEAYSRTGFRRLRPEVIFGAAAVIVLIAIGVTHMVNTKKMESVAGWLSESIQTARTNGEGVVWEAIADFNDVFEKPVRIDQFDPPREAGVYAVMHRIESAGEPSRYVIDYCGESRRMGPFRGHPWISQSKGLLLSRAGSEENIYIAVMLMPDSTPKDRRDIETALIKAFNPYFNRVKGA